MISNLPWAAPAMRDPTVYEADTGWVIETFDDDEDVIIVMPETNRNRPMQITGGRNIIQIGGATVIPNGISFGGAIHQYYGATGTIHVEGLLIDNQDDQEADALVFGGDSVPSKFPNVQVQNVHVTGIKGTSGGGHADIIQIPRSLGALRVCGLTGDTTYQGFFLAEEYPIGSIDLRSVNLEYSDPASGLTTYLLWLPSVGDAGSSGVNPPIRLRDVYVNPRNSQDPEDDTVWPKAGETEGAVAVGALVNGDDDIYWPAAMNVNGVVHEGTPAGGDFVAAAEAGLNYTSPGYGFPLVGNIPRHRRDLLRAVSGWYANIGSNINDL